MREGCDPAVIDYFTRDEIVEEEHQALIELVFNTTYEEIAALRRYMERTRKQVLGPDDVAQSLTFLFHISIAPSKSSRISSLRFGSVRLTPITA